MANIARVEITPKALTVLKLETAIQGVSQKQALENIILRGASKDALALVKKKAIETDCRVEGETVVCEPRKTKRKMKVTKKE